MKSIEPRRLAAPAVLLLGGAGVVSWIADLPIFRGQLDPQASVSMKWSTAVCFTLMGASHLLMRFRDTPTGTIAAVTCAVWSMVFMSLLVIGSFTGDVAGIVQIGVTESASEFQTIAPGVPSIGTMLAFVLIGLWTTAFAYDIEYARRWLPLAYTAGAMGLAAAASAGLGWPPGYFHVPGVSSGMAVMTALLFILLAVSARSLTREARRH